MLVSTKNLFDGVQELYRFGNGYGASVVRHMHSYGGDDGLWELAVIRWSESLVERGHYLWDIVYDTPVTDDVIGRLTQFEVTMLLTMIEALPPLEPEDDPDDHQPSEYDEWQSYDPDC